MKKIIILSLFILPLYSAFAQTTVIDPNGRKVTVNSSAATGTLGLIQLSGELSGTATSPTITNAAVIGKVLAGYNSATGTISASDTILQAIGKLNGNDALKATIASPALTGTPTAPTATTGTISTQIATTAFVSNAISAATPTPATSATQGVLKLTGDFGGSADVPKVTGIQGRPISTDVPKDKQLLRWNNSNSTWMPADASDLVEVASHFYDNSTNPSGPWGDIFYLPENVVAMGKITMFINGVKIRDNAVSSTMVNNKQRVDYDKTKNGDFVLTTGDVVELVYLKAK